MMLLWCSSKFAQLYKLSLGSEYSRRLLASGNIPTLCAIFIDTSCGRVQYLLVMCSYITEMVSELA